MKRHYLLLTACLLIVSLSSVVFASPSRDDFSGFTPLNNQDILTMVERHVDTEAIVKAIKSSPCTFDTFPPVLREMKRRGVPESVLQAMVEAPYGPSENRVGADDLAELAEQPIFHYIEQLKQLGFVAPSIAKRRAQPRQSRTRASRPRQRS